MQLHLAEHGEFFVWRETERSLFFIIILYEHNMRLVHQSLSLIAPSFHIRNTHAVWWLLSLSISIYKVEVGQLASPVQFNRNRSQPQFSFQHNENHAITEQFFVYVSPLLEFVSFFGWMVHRCWCHQRFEFNRPTNSVARGRARASVVHIVLLINVSRLNSVLYSVICLLFIKLN